MIIKQFIIQLMHNIQYVDKIKIIKYLKVLHWSTFKYFIIVIVSTYFILCISWIINCLIIQVAVSRIYQHNEPVVLHRYRPVHREPASVVFSSIILHHNLHSRTMTELFTETVQLPIERHFYRDCTTSC